MITLLTDFGTVDPFVGVMKGVIKSICPGVDIVDLTHGIEPGNIMAGAIAWQTAAPYFPAGTIHVGVVDPGVGTRRRAVAAQLGNAIFICPDNGMITFIAEDHRVDKVVSIENPAYGLPSSRSFHGRDIFAPAAAHLANGVDIDDLGPRIDSIVRLSPTRPIVDVDSITAHIVHFDVFGNAYTDLTEREFDAWNADRVTIMVADRIVDGPAEAYGDVDEGTAVALFASHGRLEIAVRNGSARSALGLSIGDEVRLKKVDVGT